MGHRMATQLSFQSHNLVMGKGEISWCHFGGGWLLWKGQQEIKTGGAVRVDRVPWKSLPCRVTVGSLKTFRGKTSSVSSSSPHRQQHLQTDWKDPQSPDTWLPQVDWNIWKKRGENLKSNPTTKTTHPTLRKSFFPPLLTTLLPSTPLPFRIQLHFAGHHK